MFIKYEIYVFLQIQFNHKKILEAKVLNFTKNQKVFFYGKTWSGKAQFHNNLEKRKG